MKIIEQSYKIISLPDNLLETLEMAGRTCYKSEDKITNKSSEEFVKMLISRGHHAMIEFGDIIVKFITNRGVTHEIVRHRLCSFAQESTRYVKYDGEMEFIKPVWWDDEWRTDTTFDSNLYKSHRAFELAIGAAEDYYKDLLEYGWRTEQAREVLPNSLKTEIVVKGNVREWRHIFKLRCAKTAHPQMRALIRPLLDEIKIKIPVVFDDINYK